MLGKTLPSGISRRLFSAAAAQSQGGGRQPSGDDATANDAQLARQLQQEYDAEPLATAPSIPDQKQMGQLKYQLARANALAAETGYQDPTALLLLR